MYACKGQRTTFGSWFLPSTLLLQGLLCLLLSVFGVAGLKLPDNFLPLPPVFLEECWDFPCMALHQLFTRIWKNDSCPHTSPASAFTCMSQAQDSCSLQRTPFFFMKWRRLQTPPNQIVEAKKHIYPTQRRTENSH